MLNEQKTFTPTEAAVVLGFSVKTVHREIDEGPLKSNRKVSGGKRALCKEDLLYLWAAKSFDTRLVQLTSEGKYKLHHAIVLYSRRPEPHRKQFPLFGGRFSLDLRRIVKDVHARLQRLEQAKRMVVEDPEIRGGEPCIRGTRVGVYEIARMLEHGAPEDEILEGYPSLKREHLELAKIYVGAYPRKGRPPHHLWHDSPWGEISRSEHGG
jgi:uncharacterized protein (DUF433 family)